MKYTLDTLPVLDAYRENSECPLCRLRIACEDQYVDSMLGAAYMEPDCRVKTNEVGFCPRHFQLMFERRNRLGLALSAISKPFWKAAAAPRGCLPRSAAERARIPARRKFGSAFPAA